jgi:tetratricopeptide (TPR) repeat protein
MTKNSHRITVISTLVFALWCVVLAPGCKRPDAQELGSRFTAAVEAGDMGKAKAQIDTIVKKVKESSQAIALIEPGVGVLLRGKKFDEAQQIADHLRKSAPDREHFVSLACTIDIQCVIGSRKWESLKPVFAECVRQLPDAQLARLMRFVFSALAKEKQSDLLKECTQAAIGMAAGKQNSMDYAASKWVDACLAEDNSALPALLEKLLQTGVSANQVGSILINRFYELAGDKEAVRKLCAIGSKVIAECGDTGTANDLKVRILDGAFIVEDYDLAVSMLEQGIPDKDELWHAMSIPKVKAHRAQARNQPREAVKYYREFMECWQNSDKEEEVDPQTHITYSKEWILARNAKRIADILDSIPDQAEAQKARAEAREHFKAAIEKAQEDKAALDLVSKEAAQVL